MSIALARIECKKTVGTQRGITKILYSEISSRHIIKEERFLQLPLLFCNLDFNNRVLCSRVPSVPDVAANPKMSVFKFLGNCKFSRELTLALRARKIRLS